MPRWRRTKTETAYTVTNNLDGANIDTGRHKSDSHASTNPFLREALPHASAGFCNFGNGEYVVGNYARDLVTKFSQF